MSNDYSDQLTEARLAVQNGSKKTAATIINNVLKQDFTNSEAWEILYQLFESKKPFEAFQKDFAEKYFPKKAGLLTSPQNEVILAQKQPKESISQQLTRKTIFCPSCAEEIFAEAKVCRFCGHKLDINKRYEKLALKLAQLEKNLASYETFIADRNQLAQDAIRQANWGWTVAIIGLILTVVVIGIIPLLWGVYTGITQSKISKNAEYDLSEARKDVEAIKTKIIEINRQIKQIE